MAGPLPLAWRAARAVPVAALRSSVGFCMASFLAWALHGGDAICMLAYRTSLGGVAVSAPLVITDVKPARRRKSAKFGKWSALIRRMTSGKR